MTLAFDLMRICPFGSLQSGIGDKYLGQRAMNIAGMTSIFACTLQGVSLVASVLSKPFKVVFLGGSVGDELSLSAYF